jgi:hypothetical protein
MDCTMNDSLSAPQNFPADAASAKMHEALQAIVETATPQTPGQFGTRQFQAKWGHDIDPQTARLVTLDYNYLSHPARDGVHQGRIAYSRTLLQALLDNYQTVADGRFGETGFGLYTPPDVGPPVRIIEHVDEFALQGSGNHQTYEGIYRRTEPQTYGPQTQIALRPADFKQWVWKLELKEQYQAYLNRAWPTDAVITSGKGYGLYTSVKAAFVMSAWLQRRENNLSQQGLELVLQAAGLPADQKWGSLTLEQLQEPSRVPAAIIVGRLELYRYTATDIWMYRRRHASTILAYLPGNSSPWHEFADDAQLQRWVVEQGRASETRHALADHFDADDRVDGTFHAGVLTALEGMALYPKVHPLSKTAGFFNSDGVWDPADYISFQQVTPATDPFAQLVLSMKRAAQVHAESIRDDGQVNRDNLNAFVEPLVQWINRFAPLAIFVPGGEGVLALAGLIDAGYGLDQVIDGQTSSQRSEGLTRTVFGLLNALPVVVAAVHVGEGGEAAKLLEKDQASEQPAQTDAQPVIDRLPDAPQDPRPATPLSRVQLLRGIGAPVDGFSDETLGQIAHVSAVSDDMLRLMNEGRTPTPMLADTLSRFRIDQALGALSGVERSAQFSSRYQALQGSDNDWVRLFQRQYPQLPKNAVEQMLDRYGVDLASMPEAAEVKRLFSRLDGKARQYQQHVRLNRAYEGLYLRSVNSPESDILALHSLKNLPGWPSGLRIEVREGAIAGRLIDRSGPLDAVDCRTLVKSGAGYLQTDPATQTAGLADIFDALCSVLSKDECAACGLLPENPAALLKAKIGDRPISRPELILGLNRMDSGLSFEEIGLRGGGYPGPIAGEDLAFRVLMLQLKDFYPEFSESEANEVLLHLGSNAQRHIDDLRRQLQQLGTDVDAWVDQVALDINDMDIPILQMGDPGTEGLNHAQLAVRNARLIQDTLRREAGMRNELADELIDILRKRAPQEDSHYSGNHVDGFVMDMSHEQYHRLAAFNVRFNDVVELNMQNFQLTEQETLNGFLSCFPNLRTLNLQDADLRLTSVNGAWQGGLPSAITQLKHLKTLNLRSTQLTLQGAAAGQISSLTELETLDLGDNPLGIPPLVTGMERLRKLNLRNTGITRCPLGIMDEPYLTTLDLRNNQLREVPQAVLNQAISRDRVLLWNNPLDDEETLQRLVIHRKRTGINLWLSEPGIDYSGPTAWLRGVEEAQRNTFGEIWQRIALRPRGRRFLGGIGALTLTADFQVDYLDLQARVWRLLAETDASQEMWNRLTQDVSLPAGAFDNPFAAFNALEGRAQHYRDWVLMGRPNDH